VSTLQQTPEERKHHLDHRLDEAAELTLQQLERAKVVVNRASLKAHEATLLGPILNAIIANMQQTEKA
jgi:hypothetical protein